MYIQYRDKITDASGRTWSVQQAKAWRRMFPDEDLSVFFFADTESGTHTSGDGASTECTLMIDESPALGNARENMDSEFRPGLGRYATLYVLFGDGSAWTTYASADERGAW